MGGGLFLISEVPLCRRGWERTREVGEGAGEAGRPGRGGACADDAERGGEIEFVCERECVSEREREREKGGRECV